MQQRHDLSLALTIPATEDQPTGLRFAGVAYSGGLIPNYGFLGDIAVDLDGMENEDEAELPILVDHDQRLGAIAGIGKIRRETDADGHMFLRIEGVVNEGTEAGRLVAGLMRAEHPMQLSIGLSGRIEETTGPVKLNGREMAPRHIFRSPLIREVSFVAVGADPRTNAAQLAAARNHQQETNPTMARSPEDQTLIDEQAGQIAALRSQIEDLQAQVRSAAEAARKAELSALFEALGQNAPEGDAAAPWLEMSPAAFAAAAATMRSVAEARPAPDTALFRAVAPAKAAKAAEPASAREALFAAVDARVAARKPA